MIDSESGITVQQESYTPAHLRNPFSLRYSLVLLKSSEKYYPDYFRNLGTDESIFVRPIIQDTLYYYILGDFAEKSDAIALLQKSIEKGFTDAYIVNQYDLTNDVPVSVNTYSTRSNSASIKIYTIQIQASKIPLKDQSFKGLKAVTELHGSDGYYRYIVGEYQGFSKAKKAIENVVAAGYKDAFIREYNLLINQTIQTP